MAKTMLTRRGIQAVEQITLEMLVGDLKRAFRFYCETKEYDIKQSGDEWAMFWHKLLHRPSVRGYIAMNLGSVNATSEELAEARRNDWTRLETEIKARAYSVAQIHSKTTHGHPPEELTDAIESAIHHFLDKYAETMENRSK